MTWWFRSSRNNSSKVFIQTSRNFYISPILPEANGVYTCEGLTSEGQILERNYVLDVMECPPGLHGERCDKPCECLHNVGCDRWTGCVCKAGWTGPTCNISCPSGKFGTNCEQPCKCEDGAECNPFNGTCICPSDLIGKYCEVKRLSLIHTARKTSMFFIFLVFVPPVVLLLACIVKRRKPTQKKHEELQLVDMALNLAETLLPWERDPRNLTLGELVGLGTFGHVVEGTLQLPGEQAVRVAVKTVDIKVNQGYVHADFDREINILVHLFDESLHTQGDEKSMHPNIIQLFGVITLFDPKRIVLEFAHHGDLQTYLTSCRLRDDMDAVDWATLLGLAVDVSKALQELERVRIVHRDVAARNVVITDGMVAKLADFGLARDVYTNTVYEHTDHHRRDELLPLKWMAPESLRYGMYTCQSDVWSFGVMLWEIASLGEEPRYPGPFRPDCCQMVNILRQGVRMEKPEECSADLYRLMCQCWCDVRDHRPTAAQLEERLGDQVQNIQDGAVDCMAETV
ncbi:fibroblast growth factor receptor 3-like [Branchiostoma floridae x Branchiostoma japonicum]